MENQRQEIAEAGRENFLAYQNKNASERERFSLQQEGMENKETELDSYLSEIEMLDGQTTGENPGSEGREVTEEVVNPEVNVPLRLIDQDDGSGISCEQLNISPENEGMDSFADLKLSIHHHNERILEYDQALKQRDTVIAQLVETLGGVLNVVTVTQLEGQSADELVAVLKSKISSATECLSCIHSIKEEDDVIIEEQDRSITEISESVAVHQNSPICAINDNHGYMLRKASNGQCNHQCEHLKEIITIKEQVYKSLEKLEVPTDILVQNHDSDLYSKIEILSSQALKYKHISDDTLMQLQSTKDETEPLKCALLSKEQMVGKLEAHIEELNVELNGMRDKSNKLEEEAIASMHFHVEQKERLKSRLEDKCIQCDVDVKVLGNSLECVPCESSELSDVRDGSLSPLITSNEDRKCSSVPKNVKSFSSNEAEVEVEWTKGFGMEKITSSSSSNQGKCGIGMVPPENNHVLGLTEVTENVSAEGKFETKFSVVRDVAAGPDSSREVPELFSVNESNEISLGTYLLDNQNVEELLLDLGSKARELLYAKKRLKVMEEQEQSLRNQLVRVLDRCEMSENRCKNAENFALNLQKDMDIIHSQWRTFEVDRRDMATGISGNSEKILPFLKTFSSVHNSGENQWISSVKDAASSSTEVEEEFISSFLPNLWKKIEEIFDIIVKPDEKTDILSPEKITSLRASLEGDICWLALHLKRKNEILMQEKLSLQAHSCFQELKMQVEKESLCPNNMKDLMASEVKGEGDGSDGCGQYFGHGSDCSPCDFLSDIDHAHIKMDSINTKVVECLKYCMEQEHEKKIAELKINHANHLASLEQLHTVQLNNLKQEMTKKIAECQEKCEQIMKNDPRRCCEMSAEDIKIKECYQQELEDVWMEVEEKHRETLKRIFQRIAAEQVSLATKIYKESYELKMSQEISLFKSAHAQEMEALKSTLEHQNLMELFKMRQEMSKSHKDNVNEIIRILETDLKGLESRCRGMAVSASLANESAINELRKNIICEFQVTLKELGEIWLKKLENEIEALEKNRHAEQEMNGNGRTSLGSGGPGDGKDQHLLQHSLVPLRAMLLFKSEGHIKEVAHWQFESLKELMEKLQAEQSQFKLKLLDIQSASSLNAIPALKDDDKQLKIRSQCYSVNQDVSSLIGTGDDAWINDIQALKTELEAKHAKEMESLRLYFEKKCAEVEKRYSEEVLTQRSKNCSHTGSTDGSSNASVVGFGAELESDQFFLTPEDADTSRNFEEYERVSMDMQLMVGQEMTFDNKREELEAKIREELRLQFEEVSEKRQTEIIKELEAKYEEDLRAQIVSQSKAYSDHVEEVTNAIKKCSEEEQERFIRSHREMMDNFLEQHQKDLIALNELHDQEVRELQQGDMSGEVEQLRAELEKMNAKHSQELLAASQRLIQEHAVEVSELKETLKRTHKEEVERLTQEIQRKEAYCEEVKQLGEARLEELRGNYEAKLQEGVEQARNSIIKNLNEQIQALLGGEGSDGKKEGGVSGTPLELTSLKERLGLGQQQKEKRKEKDHTKEEAKKLTADHSDLSNPVSLEHQVDLLKHGIESDFNDKVSRNECMGRDLVTLKLQVKQLEKSKNLLLSRFGEGDAEIGDASSVTILFTDLDKLLKERDRWKKVTHTLKGLLKDVLEYTQNCEDEVNGTIVQSVLRLSGVSDKYGLLGENADESEHPRRVHFAPDRLPNILDIQEIEEENEPEEDVISRLEESGEEIRVELRQCLARLRAEATALHGLSLPMKHSEENVSFNHSMNSHQELIDKISLLEEHLKIETMEKDRLKVELHTTKGLCEGHMATHTSLLARATQAEAQLTALLMKKAESHRGMETVTEGFGEASDMPNFHGQLQKIAQLREKAHAVLKEYQLQGGSDSAKQAGLPGSLVAQLIEELCIEGDRLSEEARKEREDLQLQVEAADKQLRSTRAFLEEQAVEREQEREEYQREVNRLHEALEGREREKMDRERIAKEEIQRLNQEEGRETDPPSSATVEIIEQQSKELAQMLKETTTKKEDLERELKAAVDKIWDLREIIRELEGQVEGSLLLERDLRAKNERIAAEMALQSKKRNDLIEELESLRSSLGYSIPGEMENEGHTALLEKALRKHCLQVEQAKALGPSLKDLTYKLLDMGLQIDKKTKEIETLQVTPATCGNCSSPSEDVSIREQLEHATWRSESPMEDESSEQGVGGEEFDSGPGRCSSSHPVPRVPLGELNSLQEKFNRHCQAQEPLLKRIHDLEMQVHSLRQNEEELVTEREVLQSQVEQQLLQTSELQARLDEARRRGGRQIHCMSITPLPTSPTSCSPIGSPSTTPEQPFFCCTSLADARHEIENLTECLEKKELELTQLKGALENSKKVVASQEKELMSKAIEETQALEKLREFERLKSEKEALQVKLSHRIKTDGTVPFSMLLDALLAEKNEEIDFLGSQLANLKEQLSKSNEEANALSQKVVQFSKESLENKEASQNSAADPSVSDGIEVLRDHPVPEPSIERVDIVHSRELHDQWFHSTKLEAQYSTDSPGLTISPFTPCIKHPGLVNEPLFEDESMEKPCSYRISNTSDSNKSEEPKVTKKEELIEAKQAIVPKVMLDIEVQTLGASEIDELKAALAQKEEEMKTLINKVDELLVEKADLSSLVSELREKITWHSQHLEKLEEESLDRDSLINNIKSEKESLQIALLKSEQEMANLKTSHSSLQDEVTRQEEQTRLLSGKVEKYSQVNRDQHMLLKAAQQERKEIISLIDALSTESQQMSGLGDASPCSNFSEKQVSSDGKDNKTSQRKLSSPTSPKASLKETVIKFLDVVKHLRSKLSNLTSQRDDLKQELAKALELQESLQEKINRNERSEALGPFSDVDERGTSPLENGALEQMIEKVQQEGIEVLSLSEIAASRKSISGGGTPTFSATPLGSPKPMEERINDTDSRGSNRVPKSKQNVFSEEERMQLLMRIQALENELSCKEREETRKRDWLEFHEKEGLAGWAGVVETVGQKQRHELNILERLGEQRNARVRLEAELAQLNQQLSQAEAEARKAVCRLGMERSHVIRLESALQQEKSNFSQLQLSLDTERKRSNMTKQLNAKVNKALQSELAQCQAKIFQLQASLKQEHDVRKELELQLSQLQMELGYATGATEEQRLRLEVMMNDERIKLKKLEVDCERKALEQELEEEKQKRMEYQQEVVQLRNILETRANQEAYGHGESSRWSSTSPSTPYVSENSFNAEDMLQNLKGINQVLGWHVKNKEDYQNPDLATLETEKNYLAAKCCHLEQKLVALQDVLTRERSLWANERALLLKDQQYLFEVNDPIPYHATPKEVQKFQDVVRKLYSLYWRSERNRKALAWQKRYFLSLLGDYRSFKHQTISELSRVTDDQRIVVDKIPGMSKLRSRTPSTASKTSHNKSRANRSFRVVVWSVIATLKMKVLILRSMTGIRIGSQSLLEEILQPTHLPINIHHSPYQQQMHHSLPYVPGASELGSPCNVQPLSPTGSFRKDFCR